MNKLDNPERMPTFAEFAALWETRITSQYKPSMQPTVTSNPQTHLVTILGDEIPDIIDGNNGVSASPRLRGTAY
jgi:hypothetical protein